MKDLKKSDILCVENEFGIYTAYLGFIPFKEIANDIESACIPDRDRGIFVSAKGETKKDAISEVIIEMQRQLDVIADKL